MLIVFKLFCVDVDEGSSLLREKRFAPAIPLALWGIRVAPSLYRTLVAVFSAAAVTQAGIEMANSGSQSKRGKYKTVRFICMLPMQYISRQCMFFTRTNR